jgi:hypothetical protein
MSSALLDQVRLDCNTWEAGLTPSENALEVGRGAGYGGKGASLPE